MRRDSERLSDIIEAASQIARYLTSKQFEDFIEDSLLRDAVMHQLTIVGEAAVALSPEFKENHTAIPWPHIAGFRNRIVHDYFGFNLDIAWEVATVSLPELADQARAILAAESPE